MKKLLMLLFLILMICCLQCKTQSKVEYNFGPDVSEANKKMFVERAEKGRILFKLHCAECHGIYTKGKDSIPNFTRLQIDNYHARALIAFKNHSAVRNLSSEQLDYVLTFLRLRKIPGQNANASK